MNKPFDLSLHTKRKCADFARDLVRNLFGWGLGLALLMPLFWMLSASFKTYAPHLYGAFCRISCAKPCGL